MFIVLALCDGNQCGNESRDYGLFRQYRKRIRSVCVVHDWIQCVVCIFIQQNLWTISERQGEIDDFGNRDVSDCRYFVRKVHRSTGDILYFYLA